MNWFVAWPVIVPAEVMDAWHHDAPIGLRFHDPADLHITLALLGRHDLTQEKKLIDLIRKSKIPAPEVSLKSILPLPQPRRFSAMVWEIANGRLELEKQIAKWRPRICRELGAFVDASPALPYLTFARPERKISNEDRDSVLAWSESFAPPKQSFHLQSPAIFKWSSTAGERQFEQISC